MHNDTIKLLTFIENYCSFIRKISHCKNY